MSRETLVEGHARALRIMTLVVVAEDWDAAADEIRGCPTRDEVEATAAVLAMFVATLNDATTQTYRQVAERARLPREEIEGMTEAALWQSTAVALQDPPEGTWPQ